MALVVAKAAVVGILLNYGVHVGTSWVFHEACIPKTIWELGQSLVATASPVCGFLLKTMEVTQTNFASILTTTVALGMLTPGGNPRG